LGKTKKRGKHAWFIEDEYVLDNNAINVEKSVRNNKPWARAAYSPYAKIDGDDDHARSSCTDANRKNKKQYDVQKRKGITVTPSTLSRRKAQGTFLIVLSLKALTLRYVT
jgi:hypothetical protein